VVIDDDEDTPSISMDHCPTPRSLSDSGRLMASGVGKLLRREKVSLASVLSPYRALLRLREDLSSYVKAMRHP
jgi:hypothetical protein